MGLKDKWMDRIVKGKKLERLGRWVVKGGKTGTARMKDSQREKNLGDKVNGRKKTEKTYAPNGHRPDRITGPITWCNKKLNYFTYKLAPLLRNKETNP
jgi:hypothetical protein